MTQEQAYKLHQVFPITEVNFVGRGWLWNKKNLYVDIGRSNLLSFDDFKKNSLMFSGYMCLLMDQIENVTDYSFQLSEVEGKYDMVIFQFGTFVASLGENKATSKAYAREDGLVIFLKELLKEFRRRDGLDD